LGITCAGTVDGSVEFGLLVGLEGSVVGDFEGSGDTDGLGSVETAASEEQVEALRPASATCWLWRVLRLGLVPGQNSRVGIEVVLIQELNRGAAPAVRYPLPTKIEIAAALKATEQAVLANRQ